MGPQHTRCGKRVGKARPDHVNVRFNGAATYSLRKEEGTFLVCDTCGGFNGAATYSLRKDFPHYSKCGNTEQASMGPQHTRCGKRRLRGARPRKFNASMGPQHTRCGKQGGLRYHVTVVAPASMGPQHTRCGKSSLGAFFLNPPFASMGPQHTRCGKLQHQGYEIPYRPASMGPQHTRCGKKSAPCAPGWDCTLQWGRNILVAESISAEYNSDMT